MDTNISHGQKPDENPPKSRLKLWMETAIFCLTIAMMLWATFSLIANPGDDNSDKKIYLSFGMVVLAVLSKSRVTSLVSWLIS